MRNNTELFRISHIKYGIKCISSSIAILNNSYISDEPYMIDSYLSVVNISKSFIVDIKTSKEVIRIVSSNLTIDRTNIFGISSITSSPQLITLSDDSYFSMAYCHYHNSSLQFLRTVSSSVKIMKSNFDDIELNGRLVVILNSNANAIDDVNITNTNTTSQSLVYASNSHFTIINKLSMTYLDATAFVFFHSTIDAINMSVFGNAPSGLEIAHSHVGIITLSSFMLLGNPDISIGSAVLIQDSSSTIDNCNFASNMAKDGAAIAIVCTQYET